MNYQALKRHARNLNVYLSKEYKRSQSEEATDCMILPIRPSGRGKAVQDKDQWCGVGRDD